jgi:hypothetical protein
MPDLGFAFLGMSKLSPIKMRRSFRWGSAQKLTPRLTR